MPDLQGLLDDLVLAAAEVVGPWPAPGPEPAASALAHADSLAKLQAAAMDLARALDAMPRGHVATFRERDWVLEHPLSCRVPGRALSDCPLNGVALCRDGVPSRGRFEVELVDGLLEVGAPVFVHGHSPELLATLVRSTDHEEVRDGGNHREDHRETEARGEDGEGRRDAGEGDSGGHQLG